MASLSRALFHTSFLPHFPHNTSPPSDPSTGSAAVGTAIRHQTRCAVSAAPSGSASAPTRASEPRPVPWGCEIESSESASALQKWLSKSGLPPQKMAIQKVNVGERGLVALKNIRKGEKLLFVPPSLVITAQSEWTCPEVGNVLKKNSVPDWPLLATYLISEASLMSSSRWSSYISALPRQPYSLLYW